MQEKCFQKVDSWKENASLTENPKKKRKNRRKPVQDSTEPAHRQDMINLSGFLSNLQNMFSMFIM